MKNIKTGTIVRTILTAVALLNTVLTMVGKNPLPFSQEEIYSGASAVISVVATILSWWKNNSFTRNAVKADEYLDKLKKVEALGGELSV